MSADDYDETYEEGPQEPLRERPDACQGCSEITGEMTACQDLCIGLRCEADLDERAREYRDGITSRPRP